MQAIADKVGRFSAPVYRVLPKSTRLDDIGAHTTVWAFRQFLSTSLADFGMFRRKAWAESDSRDWLGDTTDVGRWCPPGQGGAAMAATAARHIPGARRFEVPGHACRTRRRGLHRTVRRRSVAAKSHPVPPSR